ncbi:MAG TPA: DUF6364 family protein [Chitinophagaceae bacterium]|jgi:hypothetical protein|nr:DUF6364 family protein [Chitinophagaceae bacterium]
MDAKITLSFEESVIDAAKKYAEKNNISLSRLTEFLYKKMTASNQYALEDLPISDWIQIVSEGETEYQRTPISRKALKNEYLKSNK